MGPRSVAWKCVSAPQTSHTACSNVSLKVKGLLNTTSVGATLAVSWVGVDIVLSVLVNAFKHTSVFARPLVMSLHEVPSLLL